MMLNTIEFNITPLGDSALLVDFGNSIREELNTLVLSLYQDLITYPFPSMIEMVPAYSSLAIYYDAVAFRKDTATEIPVYKKISTHIAERIQRLHPFDIEEKNLIQIPVCYDASLGIDLEYVSKLKGLTIEEIVQLHMSKIYRVYMIGFLPGFPYMGNLDNKLSMPRKSSPISVKAGSVGIAGNQTGIYPFDSPGGWYILGQTPIKMFTSENKKPTALNPGNLVRFYSISYDEFKDY